MITAGILLAALALFYNPADWHHYPAMQTVHGIAATGQRVYITVPRGVYVFGRHGNEHRTTLTASDGIEGEMLFSAYNPGRNELLVVTRTGLYTFNEEPHRVYRLNPPFTNTTSIGIAADGAWLETDRGIFRRGRPGEDFVPEAGMPAELDWHGNRDTLTARSFPQLAPYFITDEQLITRDLHRARLDPRSRRLYVAARDYGVIVYNLTSGLPENHLRFGPPAGRVRQITRLQPDGPLWFWSRDASLAITPDDNWHYARTRVTDIILPPALRQVPGIREITGRGDVNAVISDGKRLFAATGDGLFLVDAEGRQLRLLTGGREPLALARAGPDTLLVGTDLELLMLAGDSAISITDPYDRSGFGIYSIAVAGDGTRWFGAFGGILRQTPDGEWDHLIPPGFDLGRPVYALAATDSAVFFPSPYGLTAWNLRNNSWETIGISEGLPVTEITALYADEEHLWIAGPGMISRFNYRHGPPRR